MTQRVTFDSAPPPGTINFAIGQPSADLLPLDLLRDASDAFFRDGDPADLNYGPLEGDERFLTSLAGFLTAQYGADTSPGSLIVSAGNSQALDLACVSFAEPGDTVLVEDPSYFLAFQIIRDHGLNPVAVPLEDDGIDIDALENLLQTQKPKLLYTIPSYQNPGGQCQSEEKRQRLVELAEKHGFLIVADEVYQLLYFGDPPPAAFGTLIDSDKVISLGSFSKILAPGLRLGWIQANESRLNQMLDNGMVNSGGSLNHQASHIVRRVIESGDLDNHIGMLRAAHSSRASAMHTALTEHFGRTAEWLRPDGGYFFWLRFRDDIDTAAAKQHAAEFEIGYQPGSVFSVDSRFSDCLRLSFAYYDEESIADGLERVRNLLVQRGGLND